jgi:hypothetical protein
MLEEVLGSERQHYRRELRQLRGEITALQREAAKYQSLMAENSLLRAEKAVLGERVQQLTTNPEEAGAQQRLAAGPKMVMDTVLFMTFFCVQIPKRQVTGKSVYLL